MASNFHESYVINGKEISKEEFEKNFYEINQHIENLLGVNIFKNNFEFPPSTPYKLKSAPVFEIFPLSDIKSYTDNVKTQNKQNTTNQKSYPERELNLFEVIDFLSKNDGFYAYCLKKNYKYKYFNKEEQLFKVSGLYKIYEDETYGNSPLPANAETINWKFKLIPIETETEKEEKWIDCNISEALSKLLKSGFEVRSLKDGKIVDKYSNERVINNFVYYNNRLHNDIINECKWQYLEK